jgi:hypothetical protein
MYQYKKNVSHPERMEEMLRTPYGNCDRHCERSEAIPSTNLVGNWIAFVASAFARWAMADKLLPAMTRNKGGV